MIKVLELGKEEREKQKAQGKGETWQELLCFGDQDT
jgi:hypothetical protein